jgi:hypothetical protein
VARWGDGAMKSKTDRKYSKALLAMAEKDPK